MGGTAIYTPEHQFAFLPMKQKLSNESRLVEGGCHLEFSFFFKFWNKFQLENRHLVIKWCHEVW
jgi:hypothetical protein